MSNAPDALPDVASNARPSFDGRLASVGMSNMALPVALAIGDSDEAILLDDARVSFGVDLGQHVRGVHMSRLYLLANRLLTSEAVRPDVLRQLLYDGIASQSGLSCTAFVRIRGGLTLRRPALISDNTGYRRYPVEVSARLAADGACEIEEAVRVEYSSTCPCSAAMARQLTRRHFEQQFGGDAQPSREQVAEWLESERGMPATPHSQRSVAHVRMRRSCVPVGGSVRFELGSWIDRCEQVLGTPVQAAVKRADEQEFALRNGQNLMFCEDAARRVQSELVRAQHLIAYRVQVSHLESLHAHDAVAVATGGSADWSGALMGEFD